VTKPTDALKLLDVSLSQTGLLKGTRVYNLMAETLGPTRTFADLHLPFAVVAVDITTGREVVLREGLLADAIRATISVPGVFVPVSLGPYRLVDGGVLNNVPVDVARQLGADVVIAVDVLPNFGENEPGQPPKVRHMHTRQMPKPLRGLWSIQMIMISALTEYRLKESQPEVIIRPELPIDMDLFLGFDRPEIAIAAGVKAAQHALPLLRTLVD
jgi:NTE family protein